MGIAIELINVSYSYPMTQKPAIRDVSLEFHEGLFYGIVGANGSGKTTLCSLIRGFAPGFYRGDMKGEVLVSRKPTTAHEPGELALKIGFVFQNPFNQISGVKETVFEEVAFGLENFGIPTDEIEKRVVEVMERANITSLAMKNPFELSGGQQQRMALASIIALAPDILVIDEPTSQLDPEGTVGVFEIIRDMKKAEKTIILVEHKIDLLAEYADKIIVLREGTIFRFGDKQEVLTDQSLLEAGVQPPRVCELSYGLLNSGLHQDFIPITEEQSLSVIRSVIRKGG